MVDSQTIPDTLYNQLMSGEHLYGDNFSPAEIADWYKDEEVASFANYDQKDTSQYDALNWEYGYRALEGRHFERCLAVGTADGKDIEPLSSQVEEYIAIEPEQRWWRESIGGRKTTYMAPNASGEIALPDKSVDLALALSVLHHIPNVTFVINEIARVLKPSGCFILREPVVAMGDWRYPRRGMTRRERGIPPKLLLAALTNAGFKLKRVHYYDCPLVPRLGARLGIHSPYNKRYMILIDRILSNCLRWNMHYNSKNILQKIAPASLFITAERQ